MGEPRERLIPRRQAGDVDPPHGQGADVTIGGRPIQDVIPAEALRAAGLEPLVGDAVHVQLAGTLP